MTNPDSIMRVRPARAEDRDFILSLIPRLVEFRPPPWRDAAEMTATDLERVGKVLGDSPPGSAIFVAEDEDGTPLGFVHMNTPIDFFNRKEYAHVSDVVVARGAEGRGVGRALMAAGEAWARERGHRLLVLYAFAQNSRAREIYEKLGFGEEMVRYVKEL